MRMVHAGPLVPAGRVELQVVGADRNAGGAERPVGERIPDRIGPPGPRPAVGRLGDQCHRIVV